MSKATVICKFKTQKPAEREAAWYLNAEPMNQRVIKRDGVYYVVRDWHPSDAGRAYEYLEV